jgi:hypothetical protein
MNSHSLPEKTLQEQTAFTFISHLPVENNSENYDLALNDLF